MLQSISEFLAAVVAIPFSLMGLVMLVCVIVGPVLFVVGLVKAIRARKKEIEGGEADAARKY